MPIVNTLRINSSKERKKTATLKPSFENKTPSNLNPVKEKIRFRLVLYKVKSLTTTTPNFDLPKEFICQWEFVNDSLIHHVTFEGIPWIDKPIVENKKGYIHKDKENTVNTTNSARNNINIPINAINPNSVPPLPYLLICYMDRSEIPEYMKDLTGNLLKIKNFDIIWSIRVFSTDTLGFVKDTTKEDSEKILKETWEAYEPGRCDKSRKSRIRYLIQSKKEKGTGLTVEEESILNEIRERKVSTAAQPEEHKAPSVNLSQNISNKRKKKETTKSTASKVNNSNVAPILSNPIIKQEPKKIEMNKPLPPPNKHISDYIKNFLYYSYNERTIVFDNKLNQMKSKFNSQI